MCVCRIVLMVAGAVALLVLAAMAYVATRPLEDEPDVIVGLPDED